MRLLIDTDALLDLALEREPFAEAARELLHRASQNPGRCAVAWHSLANFHCIIAGQSE